MTLTYYEQLGGENKLRPVINDFVDRVFDDIMIGFFFRKAKKERIKLFEYQLAAELLGGPVVYEGRPLHEAHAQHRIMGGQFARRTQILRETLKDHQIPENVQAIWLEHTQRLRPHITGDKDHECR
jgi:hemoglobin